MTFILLITTTLAGCAALPQRVVDYRCEQPPIIIHAPRSKTYTLYTADHERIESTSVNSGEALGFARKDGTLQAIAGDDLIPLDEGSYAWFSEPPAAPPMHVTDRDVAALAFGMLKWLAASNAHFGK